MGGKGERVGLRAWRSAERVDGRVHIAVWVSLQRALVLIHFRLLPLVELSMHLLAVI